MTGKQPLDRDRNHIRVLPFADDDIVKKESLKRALREKTLIETD